MVRSFKEFLSEGDKPVNTAEHAAKFVKGFHETFDKGIKAIPEHDRPKKVSAYHVPTHELGPGIAHVVVNDEEDNWAPEFSTHLKIHPTGKVTAYHYDGTMTKDDLTKKHPTLETHHAYCGTEKTEHSSALAAGREHGKRWAASYIEGLS
jgi:hypothetical protein